MSPATRSAQEPRLACEKGDLIEQATPDVLAMVTARLLPVLDPGTDGKG